ncbi:hypothetical protein CBR_g110 [Chara braunii]|uniref:Clu domain-containing protein n=1 Tax=Chara braunii TaxID=69332 RepID=A0A388JLL5_CHABU|nr:hypothetical protein CBR_g110 [Chara braunii]|eukprot:GBG58709.1 hypothetical protein CBR_g110 [Chara braunii]
MEMSGSRLLRRAQVYTAPWLGGAAGMRGAGGGTEHDAGERAQRSGGPGRRCKGTARRYDRPGGSSNTHAAPKWPRAPRRKAHREEGQSPEGGPAEVPQGMTRQRDQSGCMPGEGGEGELEALGYMEGKVLQVVVDGLTEVEVAAMVTLRRQGGNSVLLPILERAEAVREVAALLRGTVGATVERGTALGSVVRGGVDVTSALRLGGGRVLKTGLHPLMGPNDLGLCANSLVRVVDMEVAGAQQQSADMEASEVRSGENVGSGHTVASSPRPSEDSSSAATAPSPARPEGLPPPPPPPAPPPSPPANPSPSPCPSSVPCSIADSAGAGDLSDRDDRPGEQGAAASLGGADENESEVIDGSGAGAPVKSTAVQSPADSDPVSGAASAARTAVDADPVDAERERNGGEEVGVHSSSASVKAATAAAATGVQSSSEDLSTEEHGDEALDKAAAEITAEVTAEVTAEMTAENTAESAVGNPTTKGAATQRALEIEAAAQSTVERAEENKMADLGEEAEAAGNPADCAGSVGKKGEMPSLNMTSNPASAADAAGEVSPSPSAAEEDESSSAGQNEKAGKKEEEVEEESRDGLSAPGGSNSSAMRSHDGAEKMRIGAEEEEKSEVESQGRQEAGKEGVEVASVGEQEKGVEAEVQGQKKETSEGKDDRSKREDKDEKGHANGEGKSSSKTGGGSGGSSSAAGEGDENEVLYPMMVTGPSGEKVELMVLPTDTVMDIRQFLADAPETCFYTCYDLILTLPTGMRYQLMDYLELSEVCDVAAGGCKLEMVDAFYDDRTVRNHVRRTRDLISTSNIHMSLSTKLAMEFEKSLANGKSAPETSSSKSIGAAAKLDADKVDGVAGGTDGLGFMEDSAGHLLRLLVEAQASDPDGSSCLGKLAFSSLNPVPGYRRLQGDILYLDVVTLEGKKLCITAHQRGFFVNKTTASVLNPEPASPRLEATTLVGLLKKASDKFAAGFADVWEKKSAGHQFENMQLSLPPNPWLGATPPAAHVRDVARAEEALLTPYGTDVTGIQRDWNEELQSCRELPRESLQDRIIRDRALYKVTSDFVEAAVKGAKAVVGHSITPINPTDPERFHMYVHNGIFFSFAVDGDFVMIQQLREEELKQKQQAEPNADAKEVTGDGEKLEAEVVSSEGPVGEGTSPADGSAVDALPSGAKQAGSNPLVLEGEQATYASANNDLKGTRAFNTADVSGLYTLAMAIVDYRGYRVVAQSIIPGILYGDKSASLLYGSVDGGKKIAWNEKFHVKMCEVGKLLHIAEHSVEDGSGKSVKLCGPVECKGIVGSDDRHYILDLMRTSPRDNHYTGPNSRLCVLRPELVASFCQSEALEKVKDAGDVTKEAEADALASIALNPNVFTDFKVTGDPEAVKNDEELVKKAGEFLVATVIPKLIQDFSILEVSPMDGQTLSEALHAHGVNIRYLGKIASLSESLIHIKSLCISEMIVRSAKHVLKAVLRETMDQDVGGAIAHFLNCFLGTSVGSSPPVTPSSPSSEQSDSPAVASGGSGSVTDKPTGGSQDSGSQKSKTRKKKKGGKGGSAYSPEKVSPGVNGEEDKGPMKEDLKPGYTRITSELVWGDIKEGVKFKYQFELPDGVRSSMRKLSALRSFCQKMGVTIAAREYNFESEAPLAISDILDLHPVVKHCAPNCADARDLMDGGKIRLSQGKIDEALELFSEAVAILQQVCGPLHREVANCCRYLAMAHYHKQDLQNAVVQQHKELIINERVLGADHPDTAHSYGNMALFYHGLGHTDLALKHMQRTLHLLNVACGPDHPDVAATFINVAMMYQDIQKMHVALRYLQEALMQNEKLLGPDHLQTAVCFHALAIAFNCMGAYKLSLQHERSTYNILLKQLGEDDPRTKDSAHWVRTFQIRELQAQKQRGQAAQLAAAQKAAQAIQAKADLVSALAAASRSGGRGIGKGIRGDPAALTASLSTQGGGIRRGIDERAQKAAAEVRRRAAARGVAVSRSHVGGSHGGGTVPLDELLSFINGAHGAMKVPSSGTSGVSKGGGGTRTGGVVKGDVGLGAGLVSAVGLGSGGPGESSTQGERKSARAIAIPSSGSASVSSSSKTTSLPNGDTVKRESISSPDQSSKVPEGLGMGLGALDVDSKKKKGKTKKPKQ